MSHSIRRRDFLRTGAVAAGLAATTPSALLGERTGPAVIRSSRARPMVISDVSGFRFRNGGPENALERAYRGIVEGE